MPVLTTQLLVSEKQRGEFLQSASGTSAVFPPFMHYRVFIFFFLFLCTTVGIRHYKESDFELAKYHAELVHSGVHVTTIMLRTKLQKIWESAGTLVPESNKSYTYIVRFLARCRLLRYAKLQGHKISAASIRELRPEFEKQVECEEPVHFSSVHKFVNPHCTCSPANKVRWYLYIEISKFVFHILEFTGSEQRFVRDYKISSFCVTAGDICASILLVIWCSTYYYFF